MNNKQFMKDNSKKRIRSYSNIQNTEMQLKNNRSANQIYILNKQSQSNSAKKEDAGLSNELNIHLHKKSSVPNNFSSILGSNEEFKTSGSLGYLNPSQLVPISNSVKNINKYVIGYSSNPLQQDKNVNRMSLYTINEQLKQISNGIINRNKGGNSHSNHKRDNDHRIKHSIASASSKLFQVNKMSIPVNSHQTKLNKQDYSPQQKPKYTLANRNTISTTTNTQSSGTHSNNIRNKNGKRNSKYMPSPKRFLSLNKEFNNKNGISEYKSKYSKYYDIKETNQSQKSYWRSDKKICNMQSNSLNKIRIESTNHSKHLLKKDPSSLAVNSSVNHKIWHSKSKDGIPLKMSQRTLLYKICQNVPLNDSIDNSHQKEKIKITVNRKNNPDKLLKKSYSNSIFIRLYSNHLTQNEIEELKDFQHNIYYLRPFEQRQKAKIKHLNEITLTFSHDHCPNYTFVPLPRSSSYKSFNEINRQYYPGEYNDEEGNYNLNQGDHILYRYEIVQLLGTGSFGEAVKCIDHKTNETVCVKIIKSDPKLFVQAMTEIQILTHIKQNDPDNESNIVKFQSYFIFRNHICLVFEELDIDLYEYLKLNNYAGIDVKMIKPYTINLLFTLLFLKTHKILHCDLKPENILLTKGNFNMVKVIDFGSSCFEHRKIYTYIQSRFYRAPEIILDQGYNYEIDIWSLGCIIAELFTGLPIFPGEDERDQMIYILEYLGIPSNEFINASQKKIYFFNDDNQPYPDPNPEGYMREPNTKSIVSFLKDSSEPFQDFILKCLKWEPKDRITPEEALMHNWIIGGMSTEELNIHKQKIKKISKTLSTTTEQKEKSTTNSITQKMEKKATNAISRTRVKTGYKSPTKPAKRTKSKEISSYTYNRKSKVSSNTQKKIEQVADTITNLKHQRNTSPKKK